jgi:hypothetical protein
VADETIRLKLAIPDDFFNEFDRRLEASARRVGQELYRVAQTQSAPGISPAGVAPGGGGGDQKPPPVSPFATAAAGIIHGAAEGVGATPGSSAFSPTVLGQNALVGAAQGGVGVLRGLAAGAGGVLGSALGPGGTVAGAAAGDFLGNVIQAQFNSVREAMELPQERAAASLKSIYGNLAASGWRVSDDELRDVAARRLSIERRRLEGERQVDRVTREVAARDSVSYGLSSIGR